MPLSVVFDTNVLLAQAAATREFGSWNIAARKDVNLMMTEQLRDEISKKLWAPEVRKRLPALSDEKARAMERVLDERSRPISMLFAPFRSETHSKDDHVLNTAIASEARYLVTYERRWTDKRRMNPTDREKLSALAPRLEALQPADFNERVREELARRQSQEHSLTQGRQR